MRYFWHSWKNRDCVFKCRSHLHCTADTAGRKLHTNTQAVQQFPQSECNDLQKAVRAQQFNEIQNNLSLMMPKAEQITKTQQPTALMYSVIEDDYQTAELLYQNEQLYCLPDGCTALHIAASHNAVNCCQLLINDGTLTSFKTDDGMTAALVAAMYNAMSAYKIVASDTTVTECDNEGNTALMIAAKYDAIPVVNYIVNNQRDMLGLKNDTGETALDIALGLGHVHCAYLLKGREVPASQELLKQAFDQNLFNRFVLFANCFCSLPDEEDIITYILQHEPRRNTLQYLEFVCNKSRNMEEEMSIFKKQLGVVAALQWVQQAGQNAATKITVTDTSMPTEWMKYVQQQMVQDLQSSNFCNNTCVQPALDLRLLLSQRVSPRCICGGSSTSTKAPDFPRVYQTIVNLRRILNEKYEDSNGSDCALICPVCSPEEFARFITGAATLFYRDSEIASDDLRGVSEALMRNHSLLALLDAEQLINLVRHMRLEEVMSVRQFASWKQETLQRHWGLFEYFVRKQQFCEEDIPDLVQEARRSPWLLEALRATLPGLEATFDEEAAALNPRCFLDRVLQPSVCSLEEFEERYSDFLGFQDEQGHTALFHLLLKGVSGALVGRLLSQEEEVIQQNPAESIGRLAVETLNIDLLKTLADRYSDLVDEALLWDLLAVKIAEEDVPRKAALFQILLETRGPQPGMVSQILAQESAAEKTALVNVVANTVLEHFLDEVENLGVEQLWTLATAGTHRNTWLAQVLARVASPDAAAFLAMRCAQENNAELLSLITSEHPAWISTEMLEHILEHGTAEVLRPILEAKTLFWELFQHIAPPNNTEQQNQRLWAALAAGPQELALAARKHRLETLERWAGGPEEEEKILGKLLGAPNLTEEDLRWAFSALKGSLGTAGISPLLWAISHGLYKLAEDIATRYVSLPGEVHTATDTLLERPELEKQVPLLELLAGLEKHKFTERETPYVRACRDGMPTPVLVVLAKVFGGIPSPDGEFGLWLCVHRKDWTVAAALLQVGLPQPEIYDCLSRLLALETLDESEERFGRNLGELLPLAAFSLLQTEGTTETQASHAARILFTKEVHGEERETLLHVAARRGQVGAVQVLGPRLYGRLDSAGKTALELGCFSSGSTREEKEKVARVLVPLEASECRERLYAKICAMDAETFAGTGLCYPEAVREIATPITLEPTGLITATLNNNWRLVELLARIPHFKEFKKTWEVVPGVEERETALCIAARRGLVEVVRALAPVESTFVSEDNTFALLLAVKAREPSPEILRALAPHEFCLRTSGNFTPLHHAVLAKSRVSVECLMLPELLGQQNNAGKTALMLAVQTGFQEGVELLAHAEKKQQSSVNGQTALMLAAQTGHPEFIQYLQQELCLQDSSGRTALQYALIHKQPVCGLEPEASMRFEDGRSGLYYAAESGQRLNASLLAPREAGKLLWAEGFDYKQLHNFNEAEYVLVKTTQEAVKIRKADPKQKIILLEGQKAAIHAAAEKGHQEIVELLLEAEGKLENPDNKMNAAQYAAMNGYWDVVALLGAEPKKLGKLAMQK